jgi:hypothetical protein
VLFPLCTLFREQVPNLAHEQKAPQPTTDEPYPPPAPKDSLKIAQIILSTTPSDAPTSEILWLKLQILLSSGQLKSAHQLLTKEGTGGSLARDWWRITGIQEIAKRVTAEKADRKDKDKGNQENAVSGEGDDEGLEWVWKSELGEFLDVWSKDSEA